MNKQQSQILSSIIKIQKVQKFFYSQYQFKILIFSELKQQLFRIYQMIDWFKSKFGDNQKAEQRLKKTGFDPTQITTEKFSDQPFTDFQSDFLGFIEPSKQDIQKMIENFNFFTNVQQHRHQLSYEQGGKICGDSKQIEKLRGVGKDMIQQIGKKLISGNFNLTRISFPVTAMVPRTTLQTATYGSCTFPLYMQLAAKQYSPLEKFKLCLVALISPNYYMNMFLKPLNPVIGQTFQAQYSDGTKIFCQQISHHPPISYFLIIGPNQLYRYYGYYDYEAKAGLNSGKVLNRGKRWIQFKTGQKFSINFPDVLFQGVFLGTVRQLTIGTFKMIDQKNKLTFQTEFGNVKKKQNDYFSGQILQNNKSVAKVYGTYLGYIEINNLRYWDGRFVNPFKLQYQKNILPSDSTHRKDLKQLQKGKMAQAQQAKQQIQNDQRRDVKLRKEFLKKKNK